jgi:hypothetical protein
MASWEDPYSYEYYWPNPQMHFAIERIRAQRAARRAKYCPDAPKEQGTASGNGGLTADSS